MKIKLALMALSLWAPQVLADASGECIAIPWVENNFYAVGTKVVYQNQLFTAVNDNNPGYDPKIATWYWKEGGSCATVSAPISFSAKPIPREKAERQSPGAELSGSTIPK